MNNKKTTLTIMMLLIILTTNVTALSIAPATKEIIIGKESVEYTIRIFNKENINKNYVVEATGELKNIIKIQPQEFELKTDQEYQDIIITITPEEKIMGGEYTNRIIIKEKDTTTTTLGANIGIASKLTIINPAKGPNIKTRLIAPNFEKNKANHFAIEATNTGSSEAKECEAIITIKNPLQDTINILTHTPKNIMSGITETYHLAWTPKINNGNYIIEATINCENAQQTKDQRTINVGEPKITVEDIQYDEFKLGNINKFKLILENQWNKKIENVYAEILLLKDSKTLQEQKTITQNFEAQQKKILEFYLETENYIEGSYELLINIHYANSENTEIYKTIFKQESIEINGLTGKITENTSNEKTSTSTESLLALLIILVIIIINAALFYIILRKKK
ncbi:hypothetical protein K9L97_02810 [Candidatus Woesearchaeota archaeon]|nr:hypothetical protein [Candidatus Woesearchaeota archaeon]